MGVDFAGCDRIGQALRAAIEELPPIVEDPAAVGELAWHGVLRRAAERRPDHRAGFLVSAIAGERRDILKEELARAQQVERRREREEQEAADRRAELNRPRTPPPANIMEQLRAARERYMPARENGRPREEHSGDEGTGAGNGAGEGPQDRRGSEPDVGGLSRDT